MRPIVPVRAVAAAAAFALCVFALAGEALAGQIVEANGAVTLNGQPVKLPASIKKGDVIVTAANATAVFRSDAGDKISLESGTTAVGEGTENGVEYLFVKTGAATGDISDKTTFGVATSWATAPKGVRTTVRAEAPAGKGATEGRFRTVKGDTWLMNGPYAVLLPQDHTVTLWRDSGKSTAMCFRSGQQNASRVQMHKQVSGGVIRIDVPRATNGCVEDMSNNRTKISNEITSNKQEKIEISTQFGAASNAAIGPGTYALIDNQTGGIEVVQETVDDTIGEEIQTIDPVGDATDASISRRSAR